MQTKRIQINETNDGVSGNTTITFTVATDPRREVNFHNIKFSVSVEPQDTDANAQGTWILGVNRENATLPTFTDPLFNGESHNATIIASGIWSASNQTPFNSGTMEVKSSRTLQPGDQLYLQSVVTGITVGLASNRIMLFAHLTQK